MKRISITIDEQTLEKIDKFVNSDFANELKGNRSAYIVSILDTNTPELPNITK